MQERIGHPTRITAADNIPGETQVCCNVIFYTKDYKMVTWLLEIVVRPKMKPSSKVWSNYCSLGILYTKHTIFLKLLKVISHT